MRVAVTGAGGYLGRAIVPALAVDERIEEVIAIDVREPREPTGARVRHVRRDVRDPELGGDLAGCDAVVHLAFRVLGRGADAQAVNVEGSRAVFAATLASGARTIVHASSAAAYGCAADNPVPLREDHPLRPVPDFYYPRTKVAVERLLGELAARAPELRAVTMRPVATIGPGAPELAGGRFFVSLSDFDPPMQFTWIDDVAAAFRAALLTPDARGAYNVAAPGPVPASRVAKLIGSRPVRLPHRILRAAAAAGSALRLPGAMHPGWADMARYPIVVDASRAERELGWRASGDCEAALLRYREVRDRDKNARRRSAPAPVTKEAR